MLAEKSRSWVFHGTQTLDSRMRACTASVFRQPAAYVHVEEKLQYDANIASLALPETTERANNLTGALIVDHLKFEGTVRNYAAPFHSTDILEK